MAGLYVAQFLSERLCSKLLMKAHFLLYLRMEAVSSKEEQPSPP
jgi:hypothetical protein